MKKPAAVSAALFALALALTACSPTGVEEPVESWPEEPGEPSPEEEVPAPIEEAEVVEESSGLADLSQTFPIVDADGYAFDLTLDFTLNALVSDPATQPPGVTAADPGVSIDMQLANKTPARDLTFRDVNGVISPLSNPTFLLSETFAAGSPVCVIVQKSDGPCEWLLGFGRMESGFTVPAEDVYALTTYSGRPNGGELSDLLEGIPEDRWAEVEQALISPDGYRISYSGGDGQRFTNLCPDSWVSGVVVADTNGGCSA